MPCVRVVTGSGHDIKKIQAAGVGGSEQRFSFLQIEGGERDRETEIERWKERDSPSRPALIRFLSG